MPARTAKTGIMEGTPVRVGSGVVVAVAGAEPAAVVDAAFTVDVTFVVTAVACVVLPVTAEVTTVSVTAAVTLAVVPRSAMAKYEKPGVVAVK